MVLPFQIGGVSGTARAGSVAALCQQDRRSAIARQRGALQSNGQVGNQTWGTGQTPGEDDAIKTSMVRHRVWINSAQKFAIARSPNRWRYADRIHAA